MAPLILTITFLTIFSQCLVVGANESVVSIVPVIGDILQLQKMSKVMKKKIMFFNTTLMVMILKM